MHHAMRVALLLPVIACGLFPGSSLAAAPPDGGAAEARLAIQAWTTSNLAPDLVEACAQDFPDKADGYRKALARWQENNGDLVTRGEVIYRKVVEARMPGRNASDVLATGIARVMAGYDTKSAADRFAHCESAFLALMVEGGALRKGEMPLGAPAPNPAAPAAATTTNPPAASPAPAAPPANEKPVP